MRDSLPTFVALGALIAALDACSSAPPAAETRISLSELRNKIAGGWAGRMISVSSGYPKQFRYRESIIPVDRLPEWKPKAVASAIQQDDPYVDMTVVQVRDDKGLDPATGDFGTLSWNAKYSL